MTVILPYDKFQFEKLLLFCKEQSVDESMAASNMWSENWRELPETLLNILYNSERFFNGRGKFFILYDREKIIGCSGIYISEFSERIALAGTRTWLDRKYRTRQFVKDYFLVEQRKWAIENNIDIVALSFNDYNKNLIKLFKKGQAIGSRTENHLFYKNFNVLDFKVMIQYIPQWVIYETLTGYDFNWESIRAP